MNAHIQEKTNIFLLAFIIIFAIILTGVTGYMVIEEFSFLEALYMTVITVTTVGFGELKDLSTEGRIFTIFLIVSSLGAFTYALTLISRQLLEGQISNLIGRYRQKKTKKMKNHVIVVGYGRNGKQTVSELLEHHKKVLVIDNNHELILSMNRENIPFLEGDATEDETLEEAEIKNASTLVTTLPNDAQNVFIVLTARSLNPRLTIISRASSDSAERKLRMGGVDHIVMPEKVGGMHMARLVARSNIIEFLEHLSIKGSDPSIIEEVSCVSLDKNHQNKSLNELELRKKTGVNIIGLKKPSGEYIINPSPDVKINAKSNLYVLGTYEQLEKMRKMLSH